MLRSAEISSTGADHSRGFSPGRIGRGHSLLPRQPFPVLEDNVEVGRFATQILEDLNYRTTWAVNAERALAKFGQDYAGVDVRFTDVVMPDTGGLELAKALHQQLPGRIR